MMKWVIKIKANNTSESVIKCLNYLQNHCLSLISQPKKIVSK